MFYIKSSRKKKKFRPIYKKTRAKVMFTKVKLNFYLPIFTGRFVLNFKLF